MGKKSLNPADAQRKAERAKEKKKNKQSKTKAREISTVKRDTRGLQTDIQRLTTEDAAGTLDASGKKELATLRAEFERIKKVKEDYVSAHPEARALVFKSGRPSGGEGSSRPPAEPKPDIPRFTKDGKLRDPKRSVYYDPVFNPFGVPPPGMPYKERDMSEDEETSDSEEDSDDEDIPLPEGPPPGGRAEDSDDDIPLPDGPPPILGAPTTFIARPHQSAAPPTAWRQQPIPFPVPPPGFPLPIQHQAAHFVAPPQMYPPSQQQPPRMLNPQINPLTGQAHRAYQQGPPMPVPSHVQSQAPPPPPKPTPTTEALAAAKASATITAGPQLRDFKKESTSLVPQAVKRRRPVQAAQAAGLTGGANAAPAAVGGEGAEEGATAVVHQKPDLLGALAGVMGESGRPAKKARGVGQEDYDRFLSGVKDLL